MNFIETHSGSGSSIRSRFSISSVHSTRIYSLLCSDQWIWISESVDLRIALRDYSRRTRHWNARTFSVAAEKGEGWGSFLSWVVLLWGVELKNLKGLWGVGFKCLLSAAKLPPHLTGNKRPAPLGGESGNLMWERELLYLRRVTLYSGNSVTNLWPFPLTLPLL